MMPFIVLAVVAGIVFVQEGQRRIPVQYAKRVIGRRMTEGGRPTCRCGQHGGRDPRIFAASIMAFPPTIGQLIQHSSVAAVDLGLLHPDGWHYIVGESLFILVFTYFYTAVTSNPVDQADNLKKYGGFIPGVRRTPDGRVPGPHPRRLTFPGAIFLPWWRWSRRSSSPHARQLYFGGTSILIVIGVAHTMKQLEAQSTMPAMRAF